MSTNTAPLQQLSFRLTRADVAAFERLPSELIGAGKLFLFGPAMLGGMLWGVFENEIGRYLPVDPRGPWALPLVMLVLVVASYAIATLILAVRTAWRIRSARLPATETLLSVWPDHFTVAEDGGTRVFAWEMVRVIPERAHVFLCPAPRQAIIVPLRAFEDEDAMRAFADFAEAAGREPEDVLNEKDEAHVT